MPRIKGWTKLDENEWLKQDESEQSIIMLRVIPHLDSRGRRYLVQLEDKGKINININNRATKDDAINFAVKFMKAHPTVNAVEETLRYEKLRSDIRRN